MAKGTDFGGIHSFHDLNLIQQKVEVAPAEPKLNLIEIPGADGYKDMTEQPAGRVTYNARKITWTFGLYPGERWHTKHRQVNNALNGRRCKISMGDDPGYYYDGRVIVKDHKVDGILKQIVVEATCQPYKLRTYPTEVTVALTTEPKTVQLLNDRKPVVPSITVTAETRLQFGSSSIVLTAGTHKVLDLELVEGINTLTANVTSGTGSIKLTYQEGAL